MMPIMCRLCSKELGTISPTHLKHKHDGMTVAEYQERFPDAPIVSSETAQKRPKGCKPITYTIVCPGCGVTKTFEKSYPSSYENKFCNGSCATTYYDNQRWADPKMREKIIKAITEHHNTEEYKRNTKAGWTPERRRAASERTRKLWEDPAYRDKVICNLSQLATERWADPIHRTMMLQIFNQEEYRNAASQRSLKRWADPVYYKNTVSAMKEAALERWADPDFYDKMCLIIQKRWVDPVWAKLQVQKMIAGQRIQPTKPELKLFEFLNSNGYGYVYTGDGSLRIGTKNPDFVWPERRLIVECYGAYWHSEDEAKPRIEYFANYDFRTLIIWDYELGDTEQLLIRLKEFHQPTD